MSHILSSYPLSEPNVQRVDDSELRTCFANNFIHQTFHVLIDPY